MATMFDLVVTQARWLAHLGDKAYDAALALNRLFNTMRRRFGFPYWSLSQWAKLKVKNAVSYIGEYEKTLVAEAQRHGADGVICGHIHHAAMHDHFGLRYINCGDWVESCTAVAEHHDGRFEIIRWAGERPRLDRAGAGRGAGRLTRLPADAAAGAGLRHGRPCRIRSAPDRRRRRCGRAEARRRRAAHAADQFAGARRAARRARVPQGRDACSAPARSSSAAPTTSSPRSRQERRAGGVVAYSSGNHAQGVAHAAQLCNMPAVIVMPSDAPKAKRERTAALGAEVVLYDRDKRGPRRDRARHRATSAAPCWCRRSTIRS